MHFSLKNWLQSFNFHITFRILHIVQFCTNLMSKKLCQLAILYSCRHWTLRIIWTKVSMCWLGYDATLLSHQRKTISNFKIKIQNMSFEWFWFDKFQAIFIFKSFRDKSNLHQDENHFPFYTQHIWQLFISAMNFTLEWYEYNSVSSKWSQNILDSHK